MPKEFVSGGCPGKVARRHDRGDHESLAVKLIDIVLVPRRIDLHEQLIPPHQSACQCATGGGRRSPRDAEGWICTHPNAETAAALAGEHPTTQASMRRRLRSART
jgi:hypothetical protein